MNSQGMDLHRVDFFLKTEYTLLLSIKTMIYEKLFLSPGQVAHLVGELSRTPKGHTPRLQVQSLVQAHTGGSQSTFLSLINIPVFHPSLKSISISSDEEF